jgi:hypothetical protein
MAAEAALQKFTAGKSNAGTLNLLMSFNFALSYLVYANKIDVFHINVAHARKLTGIKFVKKTSSKEKKEVIRKYCELLYPKLKWEKKKTTGYKDYCYDISDSIIIGLARLNDSLGKNQGIKASIP